MASSTKKKVAKKAAKKAPAKKTAKKTTKKKVAKKVTKKVATAMPAGKKIAKKAKKKTTTVRKKVIEKPEIKIKTYHLRKPIPEEKYFVFVNGHRVKNVKELAEVMDHLEYEVFHHHVTPDRNDFYNWVKGVFKDVELAEKLLGANDPKHLQLEIYKHITNKAFED